MYITIVEDEKSLWKTMARRLMSNWYNAIVYNSFGEFMKNRSYNSDLYILDLSLWDWNWYNIIKYLRREKNLNTPIIIVSAYSEQEKKIYALDIWADDYMSKPFSTWELMARIRSLFRRKFWVKKNSKIRYKKLLYDSSKKILKKWGKPISLTLRETQLVEFFIFNKGNLVTKEQLITSVWWEYDTLKVSDNNLNVTIFKLRKKLWDDFNIKTLLRQWYVLK